MGTMKELLRDYMLTPSPSGYEKEMAYKLKQDLEKHCDEVFLDPVGNCIGKLNGKGEYRKKLMIFGHMDSLGFIVRKIESDGFIQLDRLGGIPEKVLPGLDISIRTEEGCWVQGVIGNKSHHASAAEEKYKVDVITSLFVDVGAGSEKEVNDMGIYIGCPAVYTPKFRQLAGTRITGTSVDNRGACACLVRIAELLKEKELQCDVYLTGTVWEEFNLRGAMMAARSIEPDMAISLDVTLAGDTHDLNGRYSDTLGKGPCIGLYSFHGRGTLNGTLPNEPMFRLAKRAAGEEGIPFQRFAGLGILTDAAYIQLEGKGVACLEMGFPARYTHTPVEVCDYQDLEQLAVLCSAMALRVRSDFDVYRY